MSKEPFKIKERNIRATALPQFWGEQYKKAIYLWPGAKNNMTLLEYESDTVEIFPDNYSTKEQINIAHQECKRLYYKYLPIISRLLNDIHKIDLPRSFWQVAFGYWLFRYICIVYDKYSVLSNVDIDRTDIKLIEKRSFYSPDNYLDFYDYYTCDQGVQQLVSQFYYSFSGIKHEAVPMNSNYMSKKYYIDYLRKAKRYLINNLGRVKEYVKGREASSGGNATAEMALCGAYVSKECMLEMKRMMRDRIEIINIPKIMNGKKAIDPEKRNRLIIEENGANIEKYLIGTFYHCFPRALIESFKEYYSTYLGHIRSRSFKYIVSEAWISDFKTALYVAIAKNEGRTLIAPQHGASLQMLNSNLLWLQYDIADVYLTTGWGNEVSNNVLGGFWSRAIKPYVCDNSKDGILYISTTLTPYLLQYGETPDNSNYIKALKIVDDFILMLPDRLQPYFILRPRRAVNSWDTEKAWDIKGRHIRIDDPGKSCLESMGRSKIVIIDHLSTTFAEILAMNVPFILIHEDDIEPLSDEYADIFDKLYQVGVAHSSAATAVAKLNEIYDRVNEWWMGNRVKDAVAEVRNKLIAPPSRTIDYLVECLQGSAMANKELIHNT